MLGAAGSRDSIFALSTAPGVAAIAVFRLSGPHVADAALRLLRDARGQAAEERAQAAARPPKQRPNDLCRCGSGKKHKKCCMNKRSV